MTHIHYAVLVLSALAAQNVPAVRGQETGPSIPTLEEELKEEDPAVLAKAAREKGEPVRGAIIFYQQHLTCTKCHSLDEETLPLGPNLTKPEKKPTDVSLIDSILRPSKEIREGYDLIIVITDAGKTVTGVLAEDRPDKLILRDPAKDGELITIPKDEIDGQAESTQSTMPELLMNQLANRQQFLDLARYVMEINEGGPQRARELEPDPSHEDVAAVAVYVSSLKPKTIEHSITEGDREKGQELYKACCIACHGDKAQGKEDFKAPRLTGRNDWYMRTQIRKFKTYIRGSHPDDLTGVVMRPMAMTLKTDGAIHGVIAYIKTLAE